VTADTAPGGLGETATVYAKARRLSDDLAFIERCVAESTKLQATRWESYTLNGQLWVQIKGGPFEAHAWAVAVEGRVFPSSIDSHGVRRWMIIGTRVCAEVIDDPRKPAAS